MWRATNLSHTPKYFPCEASVKACIFPRCASPSHVGHRTIVSRRRCLRLEVAFRILQQVGALASRRARWAGLPRSFGCVVQLGPATERSRRGSLLLGDDARAADRRLVLYCYLLFLPRTFRLAADRLVTGSGRNDRGVVCCDRAQAALHPSGWTLHCPDCFLYRALAGSDPAKSWVSKTKLVPKKGLEPPRPCGHMDLNHARLPIPPLRQSVSRGRTAPRIAGVRPCGRLPGKNCEPILAGAA